MPLHGPNGGPGAGPVSDITHLGTITEPGINWAVLEDQQGSDAYGSIIADFSASITAPSAALERCAERRLVWSHRP